MLYTTWLLQILYLIFLLYAKLLVDEVLHHQIDGIRNQISVVLVILEFKIILFTAIRVIMQFIGSGLSRNKRILYFITSLTYLSDNSFVA